MRLVLSGVAIGRIGRRSCDGSVEVAGFQGRVGLIDDFQLLLGGLVAAMGVRVVLLDQHLIARLEAHRGERRFEIEHGDGLLARRGGPRRGLARPTIAARLAAVVLVALIEAERIANPRAVALAELPARPLPHCVAADLGLDLNFAHPGVVIPGDVVGPHMFETEPIVAVEFEARAGRTEVAATLAAGVVAQARRRRRFGREDGIYRLAPHQSQYGWPAAA